jgi:methylenetetrahydrofolate dehydrogenase (NADP+)/methenyltetrahydrofolate cyclohydrolase
VRSVAETATILDGNAVAAEERAMVAAQTAEFFERCGRRPGLATILVGDDPASAVYVGGKQRACAEVGIESFGHRLDASTSQEQLLELIDRLNDDPAVDGIICQLPLPGHHDAAGATGRLAAAKDVDGLGVANAGLLTLGRPGLRPCTPLGVMRLLARTGMSLRGLKATVIGRSNLFGKPMAQMLTQADATVTHCHRHTVNLASPCKTADVLVVAVGQPGLIPGSWVKPGAVVIDVGVNRTDDGLVGDVDFDAARDVAAWITPVPGGVGPMTIAMLLRNTLQAATAAMR